MKKKIIAGTVSLIILIICGMQISKTNGNPILKMKAKKAFANYLDENHKNSDYKVGDIHYEYFEGEGRYKGKVTSENEGIYFDLDYYKNSVSSGKGDGVLIDFEVIDRFSKKVESDIIGSLYGKIDLDDMENYKLGNNHMFIKFNEIPQGKYKDRNIQYTSDLDDEFSIDFKIEDEKIENNREYLNNLAKELKEVVKKNNYKGLKNITLYISNSKGKLLLDSTKDELLNTEDYGSKIAILD